MTKNKQKRDIWIALAALVAIVFGVLTVKSGASVLFFDGEARRAAGNYVGFVVWFNFLAGFAYAGTGAGLWLQRPWAAAMAGLIAAATLVVFAGFAAHVYQGGPYEMRTVVAMTVRSAVWLLIALAAFYKLRRPLVTR